jgi:hypothetical protein
MQRTSDRRHLPSWRAWGAALVASGLVSTLAVGGAGGLRVRLELARDPLAWLSVLSNVGLLAGLFLLVGVLAAAILRTVGGRRDASSR